MTVFIKLLYFQLALLFLLGFSHTQSLHDDDQQNLAVQEETSTAEGPLMKIFEFDSEKSNKHPWHHASPSNDPIQKHWLSYFATWTQMDFAHLRDYFDIRNISITELKNDGEGFWSSFRNELCYPGTFPTTSSTTKIPDPTTTPEYPVTPEPDCPHGKDDYPWFSFHISETDPDIDRYVFETMDIIFAMDGDSYLSMDVAFSCENRDFNSNTNITIESQMCDSDNKHPTWCNFTYNFQEELFEGESCDQAIDIKVTIDLVTSEKFDSGQYIIIDKIVMTAVDLVGDPTTDTPPNDSSSSTTSEPGEETTVNTDNPSSTGVTVPGENSAVSSILLKPLLVSNVLWLIYRLWHDE